MNPDFRDMLSALCEEEAEFLVVGAYALAAHGYPRATGDIDIWIRPHPRNADRVMAALRRFGAPPLGLTADDLASPGTILQIGVAPNRIDVMTSIDGVRFEEAWASRITRSRAGLPIPFIGKEAYVRNKRATGRPRDLADADRLERGGGSGPDGEPPA